MIPLSLAGFSEGARAQTRRTDEIVNLQTPPTWSSRSTGAHLFLGIETGILSFQDIQVPNNRLAGTRADGTPSDAENTTHFGIPIAANLGLAYRTSALEPRLRLSALHAGSTMDRASSTHSSYDRIDLSAGFALRFANYAKGNQSSFFVESDMHIVRSSFANSSSSHYIDTVMPTAGAGYYQDHGANFLVSAGYGINSVFAYDAGKSGRAGQLQGSKAQLAQWNTEFAFRSSADTCFVMGFSQELAAVEIADTTAYASYGLGVSEFDRESRAYSLTTNFIKIGYSRRF